MSIKSKAPLQINSSVKTVLIWYQISIKKFSNVKSSEIIYSYLVKYIFRRNVVAEKKAEQINRIKKKIILFLVGINPRTDKFSFAKNFNINHEIAINPISCMIPF